ncbi:metabotropic glutamate receptor 2-like protein [Leptotrombidium deliense]|uniref:Metabotropic glutamate receptor 2-like protein n=1 Tax=Leptotrombidium deliense TaxID=299467 RepID=A0A443RU40_9ACAR|nr:metabotropic glutamate receptor 2-like protein [Leptotrombidium deliense]
MFQGIESTAEGLISLNQTMYYSYEVLSELIDQHAKKLNPLNNTRNVWFKDFWQQYFRCDFNNSSTQCSNFKMSKLPFDDISFLETIVNAVYSYTFAYRNAFCSESEGMCTNVTQLDHETFFNEYLLKVAFTGM